MLFNRYQYHEDDIITRGYSKSCIAYDERENAFWIKWILGVEKNDVKAQMLADTLRHLQKGRHTAIPEIKEYGYDNEQQAFAIVYSYLSDVDTLENQIGRLELKAVVAGLIELAECFHELHRKHKISHGDITPANILVGQDGRFFIIDFGLFDITRTLSQERALERFAKAFAAPEKLSPRLPKGFPFQSDIYSFGKIVEWSLGVKEMELTDKDTNRLGKLLAESPTDRLSWLEVIAFLTGVELPTNQEIVQVEFRYGTDPMFLSSLNSVQPIFHVSADPGDNIKMDVVVGDYFCPGVLWLLGDQKLRFDRIEPISDINRSKVERKKIEGKKLPLSLFYTTSYSQNKADLSTYFTKWYEATYRQSSLRENRKAVREQLVFYKKLLNKEIEVIESKSLRVRYHRCDIDGDVVSFYLTLTEKYSSVGSIQTHIEEGNSIDSEGFSYLVSATAAPKKKNEAADFSGKPFDYDTSNSVLKIKDCERLDSSTIPPSGFLFENINQKTEEKKRQLQAIIKVEKNEVQNPDLIFYLFKPDALPTPSLDNYESLEGVKQKDKITKVPLNYSYNQIKAIKNALNKGPVTVIQGPPGTGKTTVITEIVFQLLAHKPEAKILITSQTNNAVDQVLENLLNNDIPIVRLSGYTAPKIQAIKQHTLEKKLEGWKLQVRTAAEQNFAKVKNEFLRLAASKGLYHKSIVDTLLTGKDWKHVRDQIIKTVRPVTSLRKLIQLPEDKGMALALLTEVLDLKLQDYFEKYELHREWITAINSLDEKSAINQKIIDSIRVIGATCNHIAAKKYSVYNFEFDYVIMDESGKATVAEALVPITMGNNLVFVGDHRQLRPMLTSSKEIEGWLRKNYNENNEEFESWDDYINRPSLFEQVINDIDHAYKAQLTECRRSSADQVKFTSRFFYEDFGDQEIIFSKRGAEQEHNLPVAIDTSILFVDIGSHVRNSRDEDGSSYNKESANAVFEILECLNRYPKIKMYSIGVITGYTAQKKKLDVVRSKCIQRGFANLWKWERNNSGIVEEKLSVSVFDRFQGLERDVMIVDLVKSGAGIDLGFLEVPNRINVALSRQRKLLIILGDYFGIVNAQTRRLQGKKSALQNYLLALHKDWIIERGNLKNVFK
jgi:superfamily I DNA and/or RNA helicase